MQRKKNPFLILFLLIVFVGLGYAFYLWNKPARDVSNERAIQITAVAIYNSFVSNEKVANAMYLNKAIEVRGKVIKVKKNHAGKSVVYLKSYDPVFGVNCTFKQGNETINKGDSIIFKGICTGYLSDVILNQGVLVNDLK